MNPSLFQQNSIDVAKRFLQTVVLIDDQARFSPSSPEEVAKENLQLRAAVAEGRNEALAASEDIAFSGVDDILDGDIPIIDQEPTSEEIRKEEQLRLDAEQLIGCFATEGLVCAVLKPEIEDVDNILKEAAIAAQRADVVIVDWQILAELRNGTYATKLISNILNKDRESGGRLRFIVVYTGQPDTYKVAKDVHDGLSKSYDPSLVLDDEKPIITDNSLRIVVLNKHDIKIPQLPAKICDEFASLTQGLVTNTALMSLAVIREKTHTIINKLHNKLDAPFLTHRSLLEHPEDATLLLVSLVAEELAALLNNKDIHALANLTNIESWIEDNHPGPNLFIPQNTGGDAPTSKEAILNLLKVGKETAFGTKPPQGLGKNSVYKQLTGVFCPSIDKNEATSLDEEFAMLTTLQSWYSDSSDNPILSLGVVLSKNLMIEQEGKTQKKTTYWLCIQPPCDSVRLTGINAKFPLLPLVESDKFHLVIPGENSGEQLRLKIANKLSDCEMAVFKIQDGCARAYVSEYQKLVFDSADGPYRYVAQMKFPRAQATVNGLSAEFSRIGLDISEWLRLFGK